MICLIRLQCNNVFLFNYGASKQVFLLGTVSAVSVVPTYASKQRVLKLSY